MSRVAFQTRFPVFKPVLSSHLFPGDETARVRNVILLAVQPFDMAGSPENLLSNSVAMTFQDIQIYFLLNILFTDGRKLLVWKGEIVKCFLEDTRLGSNIRLR